MLPLSSLLALAAFSASIGCGGQIAPDTTDDACANARCDKPGEPGETGPSFDASTPDVSSPDAVLPDVPTLVDVGSPVPGDAVPPGPPTSASSGGATKWFAVQHYMLGTQLPGGVRSTTAWQTLGYDLDGRVTSAGDSKLGTNTCRRVPGSPSGVLTDGVGGRDNNFGARLMQVITQLSSSVEDNFNQMATTGGTTWLLRLDNVGTDDNANVPGMLYETAPRGAPKWDGTDVFPVLTTSLVDGVTIGKPKVVFSKGYMRGGVWVSGASPMKVTFALGYGSSSAPLPVDGALFTVRVADGTAGAFAGVIGVTDATSALAGLVASYGICPGSSTYDQVVVTLTQSADLVLGAPQWQDPSVQCNALSIGLGFSMMPVRPPTTAIAPAATPPSPCGP